jgi:5-methylcytosine-specific restriction endonuclease McrA
VPKEAPITAFDVGRKRETGGMVMFQYIRRILEERRRRKWAEFVCSPAFFKYRKWLYVRHDALAANDGCCCCCGHGKWDGKVLNVDHIKSRKTHPHLALKLWNLQVLCEDCNIGKANEDHDWRKDSLIRLRSRTSARAGSGVESFST